MSLLTARRLHLPPKLAGAARAVLAILTLGYVGYVVVGGAPEVLGSMTSPKYDLLTGALLLYAICTALGGVLWHETLRAVGQRQALRTSVRQHLLSIPAKYLPGLGLHYVGKVGLASRTGVPPLDGALAAGLEFGVACLGGLLAVVALLPAIDGAPPWGGEWGIERQIVPGLALAYLLIAALVISGLLPRALLRLGKRQLRVGFGRALLWLIGSAANWLLVGLTLFMLSTSFYPARLADLPVFQLATVGSLLVGLLALTPMGIGVREGAVVLLLSGVMGAPLAAALALGWRLLSVAAEGLCVALAARA